MNVEFPPNPVWKSATPTALKKAIDPAVEANKPSQRRVTLAVAQPATTAKTMTVSQNTFKQIGEFINNAASLSEIARGKAKIIYASPDSDKVVIAPTAAGKMNEINEEVQIANTVKEKLSGSSHEGGLAFLNVHFENYQESGGLNLLQMPKANCDLEAAVLRDLKIEDRLMMCAQIVSGLSALHSIGLVHGDLKPENVLFFAKDGKIHVEISDFGKTAPVGVDEQKLHTGNPRFAAPEGVLSQKAEVYSAGLLLIRVLEEAILRPTGELKPTPSADLDLDDDTHVMSDKPSPAEDLDLNDSPGLRTMIVTMPQTPSPKKAHAKRRGIEQKLIQEGLRRENTDKVQDVFARFDAGKSWLGLSTKQSSSQDVVHHYIGQLVNELSIRYPEIDAAHLQETLCNMTLDDPLLRPSMDEALSRIKQARIK